MIRTPDKSSKNLSSFTTGDPSCPRVSRSPQDQRDTWEDNSIYQELNNTNSTNANSSISSLITAVSTTDPADRIPPLTLNHHSSSVVNTFRRRLQTSVDAHADGDNADLKDFTDEAIPELSTDGEDANENDYYIEDDIADQFTLPNPTAKIVVPPFNFEISSDSEEDRPVSAASVVTIRPNMPRESPDQKKALANFERAITTYDIIFDTLEPPNTPFDELRTFMEDATQHRLNLIDTLTTFATEAHECFSEEKVSKAKTYCTHYTNKLKLIYVQIKLYETEKDSRPGENAQQEYRNPNSELCAQRIVRMLPSVSQGVADLNSKFTSIRLQAVTSSLELKGLENSHKQNCDLSAEVTRQIDDLIKNATTANDHAAMATLDGLIVSLNKSKRDTRSRLDTLQESMGILPGMIEAGIKAIQVDALVFSGKMSEDPDFYTFQKGMIEYFNHAGALSNAQKLLKLKNDCLKSPAKECVANAESYDVAIHLLQTHFGKPNMVFMAKTQDLRLCGKCPERLIEKRNWVFNIKQKIASLTKLAEEHGLSVLFESSNIVGLLQKLMLPRDHDDFRKSIKEEMRAKPTLYLSRAYMLELLVNFLEDLCLDTNCEIDYVAASSASGYREIMDSLKDGGNKHSDSSKSSVKGKDDKKAPFNKKYSVLPVDDDDLDEFYDLDQSSENDSDVGNEAAYSSQTHSEPCNRKSFSNINMNNSATPKSIKCKLCENGSHTNLAYCKDFQATPIKRRWRKIMKMRSCYRCLRCDVGLDMDNRQTWLNAHMKNCSSKWLCNIDRCAQKDDIKKNHFTICPFHVEENKPLEAEFIKTLDKSLIDCDVKFFFASYQAELGAVISDSTVDDSAFLNNKDPTKYEIEPEVDGSPIYQLQYVPGKNGERLMVFFDSGCWSSGLSDVAYAALETHTLKAGPTTLHVAGGIQVEVPYGQERFWLQLDGAGKNNKEKVATFSGLRMANVSCTFPEWELRTVYEEITNEYLKMSPGSDIPTIEDKIGNQPVDVMIGIQYNMYHPKLLYCLPSGLEIRKSPLKGWNNHQAVLAGPHPVWKAVADTSSFMGPGAYLTAEFRAYRMECDSLWAMGPTHGNSITLKPPKNWTLFCDCGNIIENPLVDEDRAYVSAIYAVTAGRTVKEFKMLDELGSELGYRCIKCRSCNDCKDGDNLELKSLVEEKQDYQIASCVSYDPVDKIVKTDLPFIVDPSTHLEDNKKTAFKILETQVKVAQKDPSIQEEILKSFQKLVDNGHIVEMSNLPEDELKLANRPGYWIPWRAVHNSSSISTPTRLVFDASSRTRTGHSLNDCLAKGSNKLADLLHLLVQFRKGKACFTADISMAYNTIKLKPEFYCYQKMLWRDALSIDGDTIEMIIRTMIYGVRPAGQITSEGFLVVADAAEDDDPELKPGSDVIRKKRYVDDLLPSFQTVNDRDIASEAVEKVLDYGSMNVKAITKSGSPPSEKVSVDGIHCGLVGYKWDSENDEIGLDIKPLFFGKAKRGKLPPTVEGDIGEALQKVFTKRVVTGKVASVFDPLGQAIPVTARVKLDLSDIVKLKVDWDDMLPADLLPTWVHNLEQIQQLSKMKVPRSIFSNPVVMEDGVTLIVCTDASQSIAVAAVYARMRLIDGGYVCNLVLGKSKLVTKQTVPKAELKACTLGCVLASLVKRNFGNCVNRVIFATDSLISLFWINCDTRPLQTAVRNQVIEIRRLCNIEDWHHVPSEFNAADIATREADASLVTTDTKWHYGQDWMLKEFDEMPLKTVDDVTLDYEMQREAALEIRNSSAPGMTLMAFGVKVAERNDFSEYLVDPLRYNWDQLLRRIAMLFRFKLTATGVSDPFPIIDGKPCVIFEDSELLRAEQYIFQKTTKELFAYNEWKTLDKLGQMKNGVFLYTGRILAGVDANIADSMLDLSRLSFAVPVLDRDSPIALCIMRTCHNKYTHHASAGAALLKSFEYAFIIKGKSLADEVKAKCLFCQRYKFKTLKVEMGKLDNARVNVAPAFTISQIDLFGPYELKCLNHQKRTRNTDPVIGWGVAIKCCATGAIGLYVMEGSDSNNFILAFQRHINRYGTPLEVRIDAGTNLLKAFGNTKVCVADIATTINADYGSKLEFKVSPPGAHNWTGMVERSIKEVKKILNTVFKGEYFSALQLETALSYVANELNNLPFCLGSRYTNLSSVDLISPNRLLLGRNNSRAPLGRLVMEDPSTILTSMEQVEKSWWEVFSTVKLAEFFPKSKKWTQTTIQPKVGQIVVFLRDLSNVFGSSIFRIGRIKQIFTSKDGLVRRVEIEYRLWKAKNFSTVIRSVRNIAILEVEEDLVGTVQRNSMAEEMDHLFKVGAV